MVYENAGGNGCRGDIFSKEDDLMRLKHVLNKINISPI